MEHEAGLPSRDETMRKTPGGRLFGARALEASSFRSLLQLVLRTGRRKRAVLFWKERLDQLHSIRACNNNIAHSAQQRSCLCLAESEAPDALPIEPAAVSRGGLSAGTGICRKQSRSREGPREDEIRSGAHGSDLDLRIEGRRPVSSFSIV